MKQIINDNIFIVVYALIGAMIFSIIVLYNNNTINDLEYGLILNKDYTITVIDLDTNEVVAITTSDDLGTIIDSLQL